MLNLPDNLSTNTLKYINSLSFIFESMDYSFSKKGNTYYYDNNKGEKHIGQEMHYHFIEDMLNSTKSYNYIFPELNNFCGLSILVPRKEEVEDELVLNVVKLMSHNSQVMKYVFGIVGNNLQKPQLSLECLKIKLEDHDYELDCITLGFILSEEIRESPEKKEDYKNLLINHIKNSTPKLDTEAKQTDVINLYKKCFGFDEIDVFLKEIGLSQQEDLFSEPSENNLVLFNINKKKLALTYIKVEIFKWINGYIEMENLNFPKSFNISQNETHYTIGVEGSHPQGIEKTQALLNYLFNLNQPIEHKKEIIPQLIEKVNLEFNLDTPKKTKSYLKV